jgi:hypothetical protein
MNEQTPSVLTHKAILYIILYLINYVNMSYNGAYE